MERINRIIRHPLYEDYLNRISVWEKDREFCRHDTVHFMDVARIAMILNEREHYKNEQTLIYGAALLHDIGRWQQYEMGVCHAKASAALAPAILKDCGFLQAEREIILSAISTHRQETVKDEKNLNGLLYRSDKLSRPCYFCRKEAECNWKEGRKNLEISI